MRLAFVDVGLFKMKVLVGGSQVVEEVVGCTHSRICLDSAFIARKQHLRGTTASSCLSLLLHSAK